MFLGIELPQIVLSAIYFALTLGVVLLMALFLVWWERKVSAHIQVRFGPMMTGKWHGWSQTLADALKLLQKEDIVPRAADKGVYFWAPVIVFGATMMTFVVIPWSPRFIAADLNVGILYIIAITTFTIISLLMAGWGSNNKYSLLGGMRSAAQIVSYEVPLTLSIMGVVLLAQSLSMQDIVADQNKFWNWNIIRQPLGFLVYLVAATAEVNRTPFDLPEAEQELVAGFNVEYSGMKFAMFFLAEFVNMFVVAAIATALFLGGWWGPFGNESLGWLWFVLKSMGVVFVLMWFRWTYPRLRVDHLMEFAWKWLLPLAFLNLLATGLIYNLVK
ncbi:MAG TPA: NADH-quinone oxidoreductase subunit NuoH [candidate division Zixibacteria bacterium]|nr:NADH-quinone oxidoreductase subunit NuoH [candidate division Zixibacteria bacterium]HEQ99972.1 NADH-quinone oxidoreductase subunit NuoH [candidate division Zixibacteria bacterium]